MRRFVFVVISLLAAALFVLSCSTEEPESPAQTDDSLIVVNDGASRFKIVYGSAKPNAEGFAAFVSGTTGVSLPVVLDNAEESEYEILIGSCNRPEYKQVAADLSGTFGYSIKVVGSKLVVAGSDVTWVAFGLRALVKSLRENGLAGQNLNVSKDLAIKQLTDDPQMIARLIRQKYDFTLSAVQVLNQVPIGDIYVAQGAASDGKNMYIVMRNSGDTKAVVCKYDLKSYSLLGISSEFNGGHCNDMTFDTAGGRAIVAQGQSQGRILTPVDGETLAVQPNINIPVGSGAITYCPSRSQYAISQGGSTFHVTDASFKLLFTKSRTDKTGYTAQGMGSDDSYVYFPMSGSSDNVLVVYDWEGNFVTTLTLPVSIESESMCYAAGRYYVIFYGGSKTGAIVSEIIPTHYYSYTK